MLGTYDKVALWNLFEKMTKVDAFIEYIII